MNQDGNLDDELNWTFFVDATGEDEEGIIKAEDVINPEWFDAYKNLRQVFYMQLSRLDLDLFFMKRIGNFPFHVFQDPNSLFWRRTYICLVESSIMTVWRLAIDKRAYSLQKFKKKLMANVVDETAKIRLEKWFLVNSFDDKHQELIASIKDIRNKYLAHLDYKRIMNPSDVDDNLQITVQNLQQLSEDLQNFFHMLCFETYHSMQYWGYDDNARRRNDTDIDRLLLNVAKTHPLTNMPEDNPDAWIQYRQELQEENPEQLEIILMYRSKLGKEEA